MTEASPTVAVRHRTALVETTEPYETVVECVPLLDAGFRVVLCAGPRPEQPCPVLDGQPCSLVEDADLVVNAVRDPVTHAAIAHGLRALTSRPLLPSSRRSS